MEERIITMEQSTRSRILDMTKGNVLHLLLCFALPLFLGNLLQQVYNLADTSIAGHMLGDNALAQIGATSALYSLITNFAFGMNNGLALTVSRHFGAGEKEEMKQSVCWMVLISLSSAVVLTASSLLCRNQLMDLLQVPAGTREGALSYLTVILAGIPLTMIYNLESALLQAVGNSVTPLVLLLFSSVLNVGLDFLFMGPLGIGVRGAAIATVLAQGVSAGLGFLYIWKNYRELRFGRTQLKVKAQFVFRMFTTGLSMALMNAIYNIGSVALQSSINALGSTYISAQVGGRRLAELFHTPGLALGTSVATYTSQNHGAEERKRIVRGMWTGNFLYAVWWIIALFFTFTAAPAAVRIITGSNDPEVISNAVKYLQISIPMMPPMIVLVIVRNVLQGIEKTAMPLICSMMELIIKVIFSIWIVPKWGYIAVCVCEPIAWGVCAATIVIAAWVLMRSYTETVK